MIGIFPELNHLSGGIYQYSLTMLHALHQLRASTNNQFVLLTRSAMWHPAVKALSGDGWPVRPLLPPSPKRQAALALSRMVGEQRTQKVSGMARTLLRCVTSPFSEVRRAPGRVRFRAQLNSWLRLSGVDLMVFPMASSLSFEAGVPSIMAIHDLQHRLQPEFPEVTAQGEWEYREYLYRNAAQRALLLLADSETGKEDILNCYESCGVAPERVKVLPFQPAPYLKANPDERAARQVRDRYDLPQRYLFYPAQFWPHKNHERIIRALGQLRLEGLKIPLVLSGTYASEISYRTFRDVMSLTLRLGLESQVRYLGYVPDRDMAGLYAGAAALVMPTFFGPTNIPVVEAWASNCPVLTSDIRGIREQAGDAAVLVDPRSTEALADGMRRLWTDETLCAELIKRGQQRLGSYTSQDYQTRLSEIIEEAKTLLPGRGHH